MAPVGRYRVSGLWATHYADPGGPSGWTDLDFNDMLKNGSHIDVPTWRRIQYLADLRNLCVHPKGAEPTAQEVDQLLKGVSEIIKTVT